jgi:hypothetical protein
MWVPACSWPVRCRLVRLGWGGSSPCLVGSIGLCLDTVIIISSSHETGVSPIWVHPPLPSSAHSRFSDGPCEVRVPTCHFAAGSLGANMASRWFSAGFWCVPSLVLPSPCGARWAHCRFVWARMAPSRSALVCPGLECPCRSLRLCVTGFARVAQVPYC